MRIEDFKPTSAGKIILNLEGHYAFIPNDLPPTISWTSELVSAVTDATRRIGELAGLGRKLPDPRRLVRMFLRREAELSSRIENTFARVQTMVLFEDVPKVERETPSVREVDNNFQSLEFAVQSVEYRPVTRSLIKEMHAILLNDVRGHDKTPGQFRTVQAHIGRSSDIKQARFVPVPPHAIEPCMEQLEKYLNTRDNLPTVIRAALAHYQFEAIHPFADGNGRIGRVLLLLQLVNEGVLPAPLLNPSAQLELRRQDYYDHLLAVSQTGDWTNWIIFFAQGLATEAMDAATRVEKMEALRLDYHARVRAPRASALLPKLIDELFISPSVTVKRVAEMLDISRESASPLIDRLVRHQILREVTGQQRGRVYLAQGVVDLFSTDANPDR